VQLGDLNKGDKGRVIGFDDADEAYRNRLMSMGLTPGTRFTVQRVAPMGDPIAIQVRNFRLSLRRGEARCVRVERDD
jgi:ferrous iron transport protein A